jgi:hypothetical protein
MADGRVAREPISGALTNFTNGTKTIALVAAAEWFAKLEGSGGGGNNGGTAFVTPQQFGAKGDGSSDDTAAFKAALEFLNDARTGYNGSAKIFVPAGDYYLSDTLEIRTSLIIEGEGTARGASATRLIWADGKTGFLVQRVNTDGVSGAAITPWKGGGDGTQLKGLYLKGGYSGTEGEYHGLQLRAGATIEDCQFENWPGDGIHIEASAGAPDIEGNANCFQISRVTCIRNRNGLFINGADANAGIVIAADCRTNRQWGILDSSFLGNSYIACHVAANGWDGAIGSIPTACTYNGYRYYVRVGQSAAASTNAPSGTTANNQWWGYIGPGGTYNGVVNWASGTAFREGGAYRVDSANSYTVLTGCYSEGDSNPSVLNGPALVWGGLHGAGVHTEGAAQWGGIVNGGGNGVTVAMDLTVGRKIAAGPNHISDPAATFSGFVQSTGANAGYVLFSRNTGAPWTFLNSGGNAILWQSGDKFMFNADSLNLAGGLTYKIGGVQVVGARGAAVADATDAASAITQLNALLARLRTHGLIAA